MYLIDAYYDIAGTYVLFKNLRNQGSCYVWFMMSQPINGIFRVEPAVTRKH